MPAPDHSSTSSSSPSPTEASSTPLPPGMVLGPDGKPCRTCTDWKSWSKIGKSGGSKAKKDSKDSTSTGGAAGAGAGAGASTTAAAVGSASVSRSGPSTSFDYEKECPPDKEILGRATWTFLHTMAAYYPDKPSTMEQSTMKSLLTSFSQFYPCGHCAEHLREEMKVDPPKVESRKELSWWMCGMHNKVNEMLGKDLFDCNKVDERWRDGPSDGRCD